VNDAKFSIVPIEACADPRLTPTELRVLIALLSFRNKDTTLCNPKRESVAERTGLSENQVSKATTGLERHGWLKKDGKGGSGRSCHYVITVPELERFQNRNGSILGTKTVPESAPTIEQTKEQTREREKSPPPPARPTKAEQATRFAEFWRAYPRKCSKADAERAFAKINPDESLQAEILRGLEQAKTLDSRFELLRYTPHPASWLNAQGWMDEHQQDIPNRSAHAGTGLEVNRSAHAGANPARNNPPPRNRAERDQQANVAVLSDWLTMKEAK
jgi:DNA-binding MarR family transcriptional regulator